MTNGKEYSGRKGLFSDNRGVAAIEMAILLPIMMVVVFATLEFGNYFIKWAIAQRAVSAIISYVQTVYPNADSSDAVAINNQLPSLIEGSQFGFVDLTGHICIQATAAQPDANSGACTGFTAGRSDAGVASNKPYWVRVRADVPYAPITAVASLAGMTLPTSIVAQSDVQIAPSPPKPPKDSCTSSQYITYDSSNNSFTCAPFPPSAQVPPNCTSSNQALRYYGGEFHCEDVDNSQIAISCQDTKVNGLKWNSNTHKYDCVALPAFNTSSCDSNSISSGGAGQVQIVQYNAASNSYTCSTINQTDLKGADGASSGGGGRGVFCYQTFGSCAAGFNASLIQDHYNMAYTISYVLCCGFQ